VKYIALLNGRTNMTFQHHSSVSALTVRAKPIER